jgi:hypothetical protein
MAQPTWVTPAGTLGTIPEGVFYQTPIEAIDPALALVATNFTFSQGQVTLTFSIQFSTPFGAGSLITIAGFTPSTYNGTYTVTRGTQTSVSFVHSNDGVPTVLGVISNTPSTVYYELIAGTLPAGIQIDQTGLLSGVPQAIINIQGVPSQVSSDVTSTFAIRAYTKKLIGLSTVVDRLSDQTFNLTVTGQDAPEFITPPGQIAEYYDGTAVPGIQILYTDIDPADSVRIQLISGELPPGLTVSASGLISGFIAPNATQDQTAGFSRDGQGYDIFPYDFATRSTSKNFEFTLEVTDGKTGGSNLRTFSIFVISRSSLTADNTSITADDTFITADETPVRIPIILNTQGSIGNVRNDNFYAYQFNGLDLDGDQVGYTANTTPPGLTLNSTTGWLSGYIPNLGLTDQTYDFNVQAYKANDPAIISDPYDYSLEIVGPIDTDLTWITPASVAERALVPSSLGTISNGATSTIYVRAINKAELVLQYQLLSGSDSNLPQGLQLLPSGDIAGRVSFDTFALDGGTTTFDVGSSNITVARRAYGTTFDMIHTFTVNAYSANNYIDVTKIFSIQVVRAYNQPYENLYIQAMPPQADRELVNSLLQNSEIFPPDLIYRSTDPNFGIATKVVYWHAYGLTASTIDDYVSALDINHYWKNLVLGEIKTARALDANGEVIYEVVYSEVIDDLVNNDGVSVGKEVVLPYTVQDFGYNEVIVVYPNSLINMRQQVIDVVGQVNNVLPRWMLSKQTDGRILGFTPAWVLCYAKPGCANQIAYNIQTQFGQRLNLVDFEVDRYELDRLLTKNWDPIADSTQGAWIPTPPESDTFDIECHYQLPTPNDSSLSFNGGTGYAVGNQILILGSQIGGDDDLNDVLITVTEVNNVGTIQTAWGFGQAPLLSTGNVYYNIAGTNVTGSGTGATWDLEIVPGAPTVFDYNSVQFTAPVDMYSNTQEYDRYLLFPRRTILSPAIPVTNIVVWTNNSGQVVAWTNNASADVSWANESP